MEKEVTSEKKIAFKSLAEVFLKNGVKVFIRDYNDQYYFAEITEVSKETLSIKCFSPRDKKDKRYKLYWDLIEKMREYKSIEEREEEMKK